MDLKCVRYVLPTFPAFAYFVIYCLENIINFIKYGWEDKQSSNNADFKKIKSESRLRISQIIPLIMIALLLFTAFNFTNTVEIDELSLDYDDAANFLLEYDPDYQSKNIGVNLGGDRYYEWYFQKDTGIVDPSNYTSSEYDYVFIYTTLNNDNYHEIHREGIIGIYEKN